MNGVKLGHNSPKQSVEARVLNWLGTNKVICKIHQMIKTVGGIYNVYHSTYRLFTSTGRDIMRFIFCLILICHIIATLFSFPVGSSLISVAIYKPYKHPCILSSVKVSCLFILFCFCGSCAGLKKYICHNLWGVCFYSQFVVGLLGLLLGGV